MDEKTKEIFGMLQQVRQMGMSVTAGKDFIDKLIKDEKEECAKNELNNIWKALEFVGFTRGKEFNDEDILKAIRDSK